MLRPILIACVGVSLVWFAAGHAASAAEPLRVGVFDVDATPPIGSPLAYDPTKEVTTPLSCRGIVLVGMDQPIVLCAVDWIGISNDGHRLFREQLGAAAGTPAERVAVHALHQHDAPWCDFSLTEIAAEYQIEPISLDAAFARDVLRRAAAAVKQAVANAEPVTRIATGSGRVEQVASSRRILGPDGKVQHVRWTATTDPEVRAFPEGVIDPNLKLIAFCSGETPIVALTYYATHPQSYYRTGQATPDFPGLARNARQEATGVPHVHFNGAGGNISAGKYNDGAHENRQVLADRMAAGMQLAWEAAERRPISTSDVQWRSIPVLLPPSRELDEDELRSMIEDRGQTAKAREDAARRLIWLRRCLQKDPIDLACLTLGDVRVLHMPGELFIEYQLAAQELRPDLFIAMAAYGDDAPSYIGTSIAYEQGGYETQPRVSLVAPDVEVVLVNAMKTLLNAEDRELAPLGVEAARRETEAARRRAASGAE